MSFTYRHGDRPLDGYTILRAIGRGGFGEVYYAVSDGGREVALKAIHQHQEIELRGARQCMNLKCPQLVTIFDVHEQVDRAGTPGASFIVMEYIEGPSLRDILAQSPGGLSEEKAAFLVTEIARGLAYLHENGIVHRDLKPENIFYEDGYVKIGDYGLSKFISMSRRSGQTISVGTVHYMAPEVGSGNYDRSIDLYSLGVILYELLTGRVPFEGATLGEILMKHLSAEADVSGLSPGFQRVIRKALRKDPRKRYPDVSAFATDLVSDRDLKERVARLGPAEFSKYAARHASEAGPQDVPPSSPGVLSGETISVKPNAMPGDHPSTGPRARLSAAVGENGQTGPAASGARARPRAEAPEDDAPGPAGRVPVGRGLAALLSGEGAVRLSLGLLTVLMVSGVLHFLVSLSMSSGPRAFFYLGSIFAGVASVFLVEGWASSRFRLTSRLARSCAVTAAGAALLIPAYTLLRLGAAQEKAVFSYLPAVLAGLFAVDWTERVRRDRKERLQLGSAFYAALGGLLLSLLFGAERPLAVAGILAGISLALNVGSPFATGISRRRATAEAARAGRAARREDGAPAPREPFASVWESVVELKQRMRSEARVSPSVQLVRPRRDAVLGGVCAGLARYMDVRPVVVRLTFFIFALLTWGWALLAYLVFWIKIPSAETAETLPRTSSARLAMSGNAVRAVASSSFVSYLLIVLGLGGGLTFLLAAVAGGDDVLGLEMSFAARGVAGIFLLAASAYRLLDVSPRARAIRWRPVLGAIVSSILLAAGLMAVRLVVVGTPPGSDAGLSGWDLAVAWAVLFLSGRLAVEAPRRFYRVAAGRGSDPGAPPRAAAWRLLGTTLVLAGMLVALVGVATSTGLAEALFLKAGIERYPAVLSFGLQREHFLFALVLFLPGLFCHLASRRWGGGAHVLRGTLGLVGGGLVFGLLALFAPDYVHVSPDFHMSLRHPVSVEGVAVIYLLTVFSFASLKWPGRHVQWGNRAPLASSGGMSLVA